MRKALFAAAIGLGLTTAAATPLMAQSETPKRGGHLTYMIPADGGPSLDGHRETTYAVLHATAPFYSVLIRVNPDNPGSTTDFTCDLCVEMPTPTDGGLTYTFKIKKGVKFHDGEPLTAQDVAASWNKIVNPPKGVASARYASFKMVESVTAPGGQLGKPSKTAFFDASTFIEIPSRACSNATAWTRKLWPARPAP